jgi:hypothetical protein
MNLKRTLVTAAFALTSTYCLGQKNVDEDVYPTGESKTYTAKSKVRKCVDEICDVTVTLYKKNSKTAFQEFKTSEVSKDPDIVFGDFNFDGTEDVAIQSGSGGYGSGIYNVYVYNATKKQFVLSKELTKLASFQGMFSINKNKKQLITNDKSGCCWHHTARFQVIQNKGLLKVHDLVEDGTSIPDYVVVTEKKLVNGKWTTSKKKFTTKEYYDEN